MITAIVLAAGRSRRMGRQKLLLPLGDGTVISRIVDEILASPVDEVLVVVGQDRDGIERALDGRPVRTVDNPDTEGDMLSSVRCGLLAAGQTDAVLAVLGDQPGITRHLVAHLVSAFDSQADRIVVPTFEGKRGHPLLFSASYRQEILESFGDSGLRGLLGAHPQAICELAVPSPEILENMNLPQDYRRLAGTG